MGNTSNQAPFGLVFAESVPAVSDNFSAIYDDDTGLSYVETPDGRRIPFVESNLQRTQTFTEARRREETDSDPSIRTGTETKGASESTDTD